MTIRETITKLKEVATPPPPQPDWIDELPMDDGYDYENLETDNVRWELNYSDVLLDYERTLRNQRRNSKGAWYQPTGTKPEMNDLGIASTMSRLRSILHKGTPLGSTKEEYVMNFTKEYTKEYKKDLIINFARYDIRKTSIGSLVLSFMQQVYCVMTRSINDGERRLRNKRFGHQENYRHDEVSSDEISGSRLKV